MKSLLFCLFICFGMQLHAQGSWSPPVTLANTGNSSVPKVGTYQCDKAIAVFAISDMGFRLVASLFDGNRWSSLTEITTTGTLATELSLSVNTCGQAVAVWMDFDVSFTVRAATFNGVSWSAPITISGGNFATGPDVCINNCGQAVAVWEERDTFGDLRIRASQFNGTTWSESEEISDMGADSQFPAVGCDPFGNAVAVWRRGMGGGDFVFRASDFNQSGWSDPEDISGSLQNPERPQISVNPCGSNAIAVWAGSDGMGTFFVEAASFNGESWMDPIRIATNGTNPFDDPQISFDPCGSATTAWSLVGTIQASRYNGTNWSSPTNLGSGDLPVMGSDFFGNAIVLWRNNTIVPSLSQTARFNGTNWSSPVTISSPVNNSTNQDISVFPSGNAVAAWSAMTGGGDFFVRVSNFTLPRSFCVECCVITNKFLTQTDIVKCLTWKNRRACCLGCYQIFRCGKLIGTVPANCCTFQDHNRWDCKDLYEVRAISKFGTVIECASCCR